MGECFPLYRVFRKTKGADLLINSRVPVGGGLSSSAALECSTALALLDLSCPLRPGCPEADSACVGHVGVEPLVNKKTQKHFNNF